MHLATVGRKVDEANSRCGLLKDTHFIFYFFKYMFRSVIIAAARRGRQQSARGFSAAAAAAAGGMVARRAAVLFPSAALGWYAVTDEEPMRVLYTMSVLPVRLGRDVVCATSIFAGRLLNSMPSALAIPLHVHVFATLQIYAHNTIESSVQPLPPPPPHPDVHSNVITFTDYKYALSGIPDGELRDQVRTECHARGAQRLLQLCMANGGIYIKLGQHIAMLDYLLPAEYVYTMRAHLLDRCPVSDWNSVRKTITEDLGAPPEALFLDFTPTPIASASLAQVHIARCKETGKKLAVKVQHRGLRDTSSVDIAMISAVVRTVKWIAPDVDYLWLVNEVETNLPCELDFKTEAANAERCQSNLSRASSRVKGRVKVPQIDHSKSSHRVLTMEYIDGVKVVDIDGLKKIGAAPADVARLISQTFNEMIFRFGDIHADPHAANMLIRKCSSGSNRKQKWELVLLDHGLYRRLDDAFRLEYAALWRSLIFADVPGIERSSRAMNAGDAIPLFAGMLTRRPWREVSTKKRGARRLELRGTAEEKEEIQEYGMKYAGEIGALLARVPRELLLLLKTNDNLRAVDAELGAGVSTYLITARECTRALAKARQQEMPGWRSFAASLGEGVKLEGRLWALRAAAVIDPLREALRFGGGQGGGEYVDVGVA